MKKTNGLLCLVLFALGILIGFQIYNLHESKERQDVSIRFVEADIVQDLKGGIVIANEFGTRYYIEFDRWVYQSDVGDFYDDELPSRYR